MSTENKNTKKEETQIEKTVATTSTPTPEVVVDEVTEKIVGEVESFIFQVKPISKKKWHKKTGEEDITRTKGYRALCDVKSRTYKTGLIGKAEVELAKRKNITLINEEEKYGLLLGVDLHKRFNPDQPHPVWDGQMGVIKLENNVMFFNTKYPLDFVKHKVMLAGKFCANSLEEIEEGKWPDATHVMISEDAEINIAASKVVLKEEAVVAGAGLSLVRKTQIVSILSEKTAIGKSNNYITVTFSKLVEKDPASILRHINRNKDDIAVEALVSEALLRNVLVRKGAHIRYFEANLGMDIPQVAKYLQDPNNQELRLRIQEEIIK